MNSKVGQSRFERGLENAHLLGAQPDPRLVESVGDLGKYLVEFAFGDVYERPGLSLREREIATVAALVVMGRGPQVRAHFKSSLHVGVTWDELAEVVLQTVPFAGFPTALDAMLILTELKPQGDGSDHAEASPLGSDVTVTGESTSADRSSPSEETREES
jgi:4-carboxymuconolactone decarboxylase